MKLELIKSKDENVYLSSNKSELKILLFLLLKYNALIFKLKFKNFNGFIYLFILGGGKYNIF